MARLAIDEAAWSNAWRARSTGEKAMLALGLLAVAVSARSVLVAAAVLVLAVGAALAGARVPARTYLRAVAAPASFVILGAASIAVTWGSGVPDARWSFGWIGVTDRGLDQALLVLVRALAATSALALLATTTPMSDLLTGMRRLRLPEVVIDVAGLVYRMLFTLLDTLGGIREAQAARLGYASGRAARRSLGMLGAAVLVQAWTRARRLEDGLAGRGYTTSLRTLAVAKPVSVPFVLVSGVVVIALATWSAVTPS